MAKTQKWTASTFVSLVHDNLTEKGQKVKKSDLNWAVKDAFQAAIAAGARGMRVRFPEIGALASRDVKARKAGKGTNPFTGESIMLKARPASKKPRWSFPKAVREAYIRTAARKAAEETVRQQGAGLSRPAPSRSGRLRLIGFLDRVLNSSDYDGRDASK